MSSKTSLTILAAPANAERREGTGVINRMKILLRILMAGNGNDAHRSHRIVRVCLGLSLVILTTGCASGTKNVPLNIQSDPLGAYVVFQITKDDGAKSDWIFLGNTPLLTTRQYSKEELDDENSIVLRVMKEGFFDQTKVFKGRELRRESKSKGRVFWNPRMVPN